MPHKTPSETRTFCDPDALSDVRPLRLTKTGTNCDEVMHHTSLERQWLRHLRLVNLQTGWNVFTKWSFFMVDLWWDNFHTKEEIESWGLFTNRSFANMYCYGWMDVGLKNADWHEELENITTILVKQKQKLFSWQKPVELGSTWRKTRRCRVFYVKPTTLTMNVNWWNKKPNEGSGCSCNKGTREQVSMASWKKKYIAD